jgi:hypothetical protein
METSRESVDYYARTPEEARLISVGYPP